MVSKRRTLRKGKKTSRRRTSKRAMSKGNWNLSRALSRTAKMAAAGGAGYVAGKVGRSIHRKYKNYRSRKNMERVPNVTRPFEFIPDQPDEIRPLSRAQIRNMWWTRGPRREPPQIWEETQGLLTL